MDRRKKGAITVGVILVLFTAVVVGIFVWINVNQKHTGDALYDDIQSALTNYPELNVPYESNKIYYCDDTNEYMLIKHGQRQVTGIRSIEGEAVYYSQGQSWRLNAAGELISIGIAKDPVEGVLREAVETFLTAQDVTYSYHYATGMPLPMWVYPGENYVKCERAEYPDNMEIMVRGESNDEEYIRWNILNCDEKVLLFLVVQEANLRQEVDEVVYLNGWGNIDDNICNMIFE